MANETQQVVPEVVQVDTALLDDLRLAQQQGLLEQLRPQEKAGLLKEATRAMEVEQEQALQPSAELAKGGKQTSFIKQIMQPVQDAASNPLAAVGNAVRGVERSFNPLPLVNLATPGLPHIQDDLETFESLFTFPVVRGAELAARMFIPEDQRPSLTTFAQVVNDQRALDKQLRSLTPGIQEGAELGSAAASLTQLASTGLKAATRLSKNLPAAIKAVPTMIADYRAASSAKKTRALFNDIMLEGNGPVYDAVINRPEQVQKILKDGNVSMLDFANELETELSTIGERLGKRVGQFRDAAFADNKTRIPVPKEIPAMLESLRARTTFQGKSVFAMSKGGSGIERQLQAAENAAKLGVITPNQAMVWTDILDDIIKFGNTNEAGANAVKSANSTLLEIRRSIKNALRENNIGWADADSAFSGYITESDGLLKSLRGDRAESVVDGLFGKNKNVLRGRIEKALDYMEQIDPTARGNGEAFFARLANAKAASKISDVKARVSDPIADNTNRIVQRWTSEGRSIGQTIGFGIGGGIPHMVGASDFISTGTAGMGVLTGRYLGARAGYAVGKYMANPDRVLQAAIRSNKLSRQSRQLANDMLYLTRNFGPESQIAFLDLVGPIPAVNELIKFSSPIKQKKEGEK